MHDPFTPRPANEADQAPPGIGPEAPASVPWSPERAERAQPVAGPGEPPAPNSDQPPAETSEPTRLHPAYMVMTLLRTLRGFILPFVVIVIGGGRQEFFTMVVALGIALVSALSSVLNWWFTNYELTDRSFTLRTGWLNRQERSVPLERIQSIDLQETPLARLLGVVALKIETAAVGANRVDISLDAVSRREAASLRHRLFAARARLTGRTAPLPAATGVPDAAASGAPGETAPATRGLSARLGRPPELGFGESGELIRAITAKELLFAGMTSGRVGPALAIVGAILQFGTELFPEDFYDRLAESLPALDVTVAAIVLLASLLLAWIISIVDTVLAFSGFTLRRDGEYLHIASGLLDRRRTTVPLRRIQAVSISEGWLRQPFGYASMRYVSAGVNVNDTGSGVLFPLVRRTEIDELLRAAVPGFAASLAEAEAAGERLPPRAKPRYVMRIVWTFLVIVAIAVVVAALLPLSSWWWGLWLLLLVPGAVRYGLMSFRETFWHVDADERYVVRTRGVARTTTIVPKVRIQQRHILQNPFQRRAKLATFRVNYAGAAFSNGVEVVHMGMDQADAMATRLALGPVPRRRRSDAAPGPLAAKPVSVASSAPSLER